MPPLLTAALLNELLADPFLEESTRAPDGAAARSPTLVALKFAALRNLGGLLASGREARLVDALDAYCQAAALDSTDLVLWCVLCCTPRCHLLQPRWAEKCVPGADSSGAHFAP